MNSKPNSLVKLAYALRTCAAIRWSTRQYFDFLRFITRIAAERLKHAQECTVVHFYCGRIDDNAFSGDEDALLTHAIGLYLAYTAHCSRKKDAVVFICSG